MSLKIMIAGCSRDERDGVEASVKAAFGNRADAEPWNVSLVNVANQWSIQIDGPDPRYKSLSLIATSSELTSCLRDALSSGNGAERSETAPTRQGAGTAGASECQEQHDCEECAAPFQVHYLALEGEGSDLFPVACPHCWHVNKVPISESAGSNGDYSARAI